MTFNFTTTARTWYVDSAIGNDSNNGTTTASAFATLQHAADMTGPGDVVYVMPGIGYGGGTSGTAPLIISTSGTAGRPITYTAFPGTRPVINGTQSAGVISGTYPLSYITINGFEIAGWLQNLTWAGACASAGSGTALTNNVYNGDATYFAGSAGNIIHHITVMNCYVHDFPGGGLGASFGDYLTFTGNTIFNCCNYSPWQTSGISLYELHNIDSGTGTKNVIRGNTIYNCMNLVPAQGSFTTTTLSGQNAAGVTYIANIVNSGSLNYGQILIDVTNGSVPPGSIVGFFGSGYCGISPMTGYTSSALTITMGSGDTLQYGYPTDGEGIIIDDNINSQSDSIAYVGRTLVTNNIVYNCGSSGIQIGTSKNVDVTFNTCYLNQRGGGGVSQNGEIGDYHTNGSNIYNNICYALSTAPSGWTQATGTTTWSHNAFFGGNAAHTLPGTSNVTTNPLFKNASIDANADFSLLAGSPAINAASSTYTRTTDIAGNVGLVGASYDIGAYEYNSAILTQAPYRVVTATGTITHLSSDQVIVVNKTTPAATAITLMSSPPTGQTVTIKDGAGNAATYNVTITPAAGLIDGAGTFVMNNNYGASTLIYNGSSWNVV